MNLLQLQKFLSFVKACKSCSVCVGGACPFPYRLFKFQTVIKASKQNCRLVWCQRRDKTMALNLIKRTYSVLHINWRIQSRSHFNSKHRRITLIDKTSSIVVSFIGHMKINSWYWQILFNNQYECLRGELNMHRFSSTCLVFSNKTIFIKSKTIFLTFTETPQSFQFATYIFALFFVLMLCQILRLRKKVPRKKLSHFILGRKETPMERNPHGIEPPRE